MFAPLFALTRSGLQEILCSGTVGVITKNKEFFFPNETCPIIARSLLKPWQLVASGVYDQGVWPKEKDWLMGASSHFSEPFHLEALNKLLQLTGVSTDQLQLDQEDKLHHPCAGKHIIWLWRHLQTSQGKTSSSYLSKESPVHLRLEQLIQEGIKEPYQWHQDGCNMPTLASSLHAQTLLWHQMGQSSSPAWEAFKSHAVSHPEMIGGTNRLDSLIISQSKGLLLAKEGADGLLAVTTNFPEKDKLNGFTFLIKIATGYFPVFSALVLIKLLEQFTPFRLSPIDAVHKSLQQFTSKAIGKGQQLTFFL